MAHTPSDRPTAASITTEQVLNVTRYLTAKELRAYQGKLTATSKELDRLIDKTGLGRLMGLEEQELIRQAAGLVRTINLRIEHAKEKKQREEKGRADRFRALDQQAHELTQQAYPLPIETPEQQLEVVRTALVLNQARVLQIYYSPREFTAKLRLSAKPDPQKARDWSASREIHYLRSEIHQSVRDHINSSLNLETFSHDIPTNLATLQAKCDELRPQVLAQEAETIRLWSEALANPQGGTR